MTTKKDINHMTRLAIKVLKDINSSAKTTVRSPSRKDKSYTSKSQNPLKEHTSHMTRLNRGVYKPLDEPRVKLINPQIILCSCNHIYGDQAK